MMNSDKSRLKKDILILSAAVFTALLFSQLAFAFPIRLISWEQDTLNPYSLARGESMEYTLSFRANLPIPKADMLKVRAEGDAAGLIEGAEIILPEKKHGKNKKNGNTIKKRQTVEVKMNVSVPSDTPTGEYYGELSLAYRAEGDDYAEKKGERAKKRKEESGNKHDDVEDEDFDKGYSRKAKGFFKNFPLFFAPSLPFTLTVSDIPLPPAPGKAGDKTLEGIDDNDNQVRDDVERFIVLSFPEDTPAQHNTREALFQYARAAQDALLNADDKEMAREKSGILDEAQYCLWYIMNLDIEEAGKIRSSTSAHFLNTVSRSVEWSKFNKQLSGQVTSLPPDEELINNCNFIPL